MINSANFGLSNPGLTNDLRNMNFNFPGFPCGGYGYGYGGVGYGYGNRDAITLRGPLGYDQYSKETEETQKKNDRGLLKGLVTAVIAAGATILGLKTGAGKNLITKIKPTLTPIWNGITSAGGKVIKFFKGLIK